MTDENKDIARRFFEQLSDGDIEGAMSLFAEDGTFWQAGSDGPGRVISLAEVRDMFRSVIGAIPTGIVFTVGDLLAEGNWVVAQVGCQARLQNGNDYRNSYCFFFEILDGLIVSGREYMDTMHAVNAFSTRGAESS
jgi:ketosteroid isomerase-like protein